MDLLINETNPTKFVCQANGVPVPYVKWYFNGDMINLSNNSKYNISLMALNESVIESTLNIINVKSSDVGSYTCEAENIIGKDQSSGVLTVNGKCIVCIHKGIVVATLKNHPYSLSFKFSFYIWLSYQVS